MEIKPFSNADHKSTEFYPGYFRAELETIAFNDTEIFSKEDKSLSYVEHTKQRLRFWFKKSDICSQFGPVVTSEGTKKIHCKIKVSLEDLTLKNENGYLSFIIYVDFDIMPAGGYDEYGSFGICTNNMEIRVDRK